MCDKDGNLNMIKENADLVSCATMSGQHIGIQAEIISHAESKFLEIMEMDGITAADLMKSLSLEQNRKNVFKAGEGGG